MSLELLLGVAVPSVGAIVWLTTMEFRTRTLERHFLVLELQQRIILRGLVRAGFVTQEEIDKAHEEAKK